MSQPAYAIGVRYIRVRETGAVFPVHMEQLKMVKKDLADLVEWDGTHFFKVDLGAMPREEPVKITPPPKPEPVTPPPQVQRIFAPPGAAAPQVEVFAPPPVGVSMSPEAALAAAAAAAPAPAPVPAAIAVAPVAAPVAAPAPTPQMPPIVKTVIGAPVAPRPTLDLSAEPPSA